MPGRRAPTLACAFVTDTCRRAGG